jgi:hypothetical protein
MTPIRPSVSPLPSFAARPDTSPRVIPATPWTKRALPWVALLRKRAPAPAEKA